MVKTDNLVGITICWLCSVVLALLSVVSCRKEHLVHNPVPDTSAPISFSTYTVSSKGLDPIDDGTLPQQFFGVFAWWVPAADTFGAGHKDNLYIDNVKAINDGVVWKCSPTCYWPVANNACFFAYAPYIESTQAEASDPTAMSFTFPLDSFSGDGMPRGSFTQTDNVTRQVDFCLATPQLNLAASYGTVPIKLDHALSNLKFYIRIKGTEKPGTVYKVEEMQLSGLIKSNSFSLLRNPAEGEKGFVWDNPGESAVYDATYTLKDSGSPTHISPNSWIKYSSEEATEDNSTKINDLDNGRLYLLPQTLTSNAKLKITLALYKQASNSSEYTKLSSLQPFTLSLPSMEWKPGQTVSYFLTLDFTDGEYYIDTAISVRMEDWKESGNSHTEETIE
ncbi:MAG: fimbrillin family protein [Candidatus Cryptobacteroides sp.]